MVPILYNHDHEHPPIGLLFVKDGKLFAEFYSPVDRDTVESIFGGIGYAVLDAIKAGKNPYIKKIQILEFSFEPKHGKR